MFPRNFSVLLTTVSWAVTKPIFFKLDHTSIRDLQCGLLAEEDRKTVKRIIEEDWQQMLYK